MTRINSRTVVRTNPLEPIVLDLPEQGALHLGIDVGSVSCKLALLDDERSTHYLYYCRTHGRPIEAARQALAALFKHIPPSRIATMVGTGSAGRALCELLNIDFVNELICQAAAIRHLRPQVRTLIEMGGQDSKVLFLSDDPQAPLGDMVDFSMNTNCAAGTGSFLDQQASRLGVDIEREFGELALQSQTPPRVAGRCSVFAKSDMIHLQQQATPVHDIVAGLCLGLARNLKSSLCQGKDIIKPVAFCGGVAGNAGVVRAIKDVFELGPDELAVPGEHAVTGAIGAVLVQQNRGAGRESAQEPRVLLAKLDDFLAERRTVGYRLKPLAQPSHDAPASKVHTDKLTAARAKGERIGAYIGIDVGSISTNVVVMDENKEVLSKAYLMTASRPLEAVRKGLELVGAEVQDVVDIRGAATTGSGRYLTGDFIGADLVINEITAQATGAALVDSTVDTIFEIGGQDSKYISLEDGVVVDFEMNHACAAGTGSFLEEQAERLGMNIKGEFAQEAFASAAPIRLGERCTVFMESDLISYQQQGAERRDLVAGLSYSIVTNYLNRVVAHRKIGKRIFFQGGTAFNRAVVSAFEAVTGKSIIVPDHHEVTGALGAAELARRHVAQQADEKSIAVADYQSDFRGFDLSRLDYQVRSFECTHCANNCEIKEVQIAGSEPLYYGSRCDRYNLKETKTDRNIADLFNERQKLLEQYAGLPAKSAAEPSAQQITVGLPMCLSNYQFLPLWGTFLRELGLHVVPSGRSSKSVIHEGVEAVLAQPCFPVKVAHGHVLALMKKDVDYIWLPSIVSMPKDYSENKHNQLCPYVQTIPYQVRAALQAKDMDLANSKPKLIELPVRFQDGFAMLLKTLLPLCETFGVSKDRIEEALKRGLAQQEAFENACRQRGREVMEQLEPGQKACVIVSRPYNGCDPGISLDVPRKLRKLGVLAMPMDFLDLPSAPITEPQLQEDMYWKYGQRIFRAAHIIRDDPRLNAIYISNFSCGPDSFVITLFKELMVVTDAEGVEHRKPTLVLEIDEHSADAGVVTRLEAFLESLRSVEGRRGENEAPKQEGQPANSPWRKAWGDCSERTLYIPWMGDYAHGLAAAFRHCGQDAQVLPLADDETMRWGRQYTTGKECLPCTITTGDMLKKITEQGADPDKMAFFMPSGSGPCRFGQYNCLQRLVLKQADMPNTLPIVAPNQDSSFYEHFRRFRKDPTRLGFLGIVAIELLHKMLLRLRPYEPAVGVADEMYEKSRQQVIEAIEQGHQEKQLAQLMKRIAADWNRIGFDRSQPKPLICVVGEIYVRSHSVANNDVVRQLEALGGEVSLAGFCEWLYYTNLTRKWMAKRHHDWKMYFVNVFKTWVQHRMERTIAAPLEAFAGPLAEGNVQDVLDCAEPYIHHSFEGEAALSAGKIVEMFHHGAAGAVNVMPFTCMPSTIVAGISRKIAQDAQGLPIINISYDGQGDPTLQTRLEAFMHQARQFHQKAATSPAAVH